MAENSLPIVDQYNSSLNSGWFGNFFWKADLICLYFKSLPAGTIYPDKDLTGNAVLASQEKRWSNVCWRGKLAGRVWNLSCNLLCSNHMSIYLIAVLSPAWVFAAFLCPIGSASSDAIEASDSPTSLFAVDTAAVAVLFAVAIAWFMPWFCWWCWWLYSFRRV